VAAGALLERSRERAPAGPRIVFAEDRVEARGFARRDLRELVTWKPGDARWKELLSVRVLSANGSDVPPVIGTYKTERGRVVFEPRFPLTPGLRYRVQASARLDSERTVERDFELPATTRQPTARVIAVYPEDAQLPANTLRLYIQFSEAMDVGNALEHIHLRDHFHRDIERAFLAVDQELWDAEHKRLTLLFDPGRVKRGIRTNVEAGRALVAGKQYELVIDSTWRAASGAPLVAPYEMRFSVTAPDYEQPKPDRWQVTAPRAGTRNSLRIAFGEALDRALAERLIVSTAGGQPVDGRINLSADGTNWTFTPAAAWSRGEHHIVVSVTLEDVAGNSIRRAYDVDRASGGVAAEAATSASETRIIRVTTR
jgi:hypothetical protein